MVERYTHERHEPGGVAVCIACGCDDGHACWDDVSARPCCWLRVDRSRGLGVCSACPDAVVRWEAGERSVRVAR